MKKIIVVNNPKDWESGFEGVETVSARDYLTTPQYTEMREARVFNLCRNYRYQSTGYYVSLLAEARGHKAIPNVTTIQDFKAQAVVRVVTDDLDELIQKSLSKLKSDQFTLSIYFGQNLAKQYAALSAKLYNQLQAPLLRAKFVRSKKWVLQSVHPVPLNEIPDDHKPYVAEFAKAYFGKKRYQPAKTTIHQYDLALLFNPAETSPPSERKAIDKFIGAAESIGFGVELITKDDYSRLGEFDALFIRETTAVNHHTYRFARRALADGLAVIDDPVSILRCTNKVYLAEILNKAKIPTPKTLIVHKDNRQQVAQLLGLPCVLKQPDSSFSQGVLKAKDQASLEESLNKMLAASDLIIAQAFTPTPFDWRIGVLDNKPLFACKYFMAKDHWQIYNWTAGKDDLYGDSQSFRIEDVPPAVISASLKAANLIGNGLYGVDVKEIDGKAYIIEVNDNPSIDVGIEDGIMKDQLYVTIMQSLKNRVEQRVSGSKKPPTNGQQ